MCDRQTESGTLLGGELRFEDPPGDCRIDPLAVVRKYENTPLLFVMRIAFRPDVYLRRVTFDRVLYQIRHQPPEEETVSDDLFAGMKVSLYGDRFIRDAGETFEGGIEDPVEVTL